MTTLTLEQWRAWAETATRNYTDDAIGVASTARRAADARNSRLVETTRQSDGRREAAVCPPTPRNKPKALRTTPEQENAL